MIRLPRSVSVIKKKKKIEKLSIALYTHSITLLHKYAHISCIFVGTFPRGFTIFKQRELRKPPTPSFGILALNLAGHLYIRIVCCTSTFITFNVHKHIHKYIHTHTYNVRLHYFQCSRNSCQRALTESCFWQNERLGRGAASPGKSTSSRPGTIDTGVRVFEYVGWLVSIFFFSPNEDRIGTHL